MEGFVSCQRRDVETLFIGRVQGQLSFAMVLRALLCAAGLLGTAHSILHELNPTNPEHHEQIKTLLEDCELQMIFVSPPKQPNRPALPT